MILYKKIHLDYLDIIRQKVLEYFPNDAYQRTHLFYIPNNKEIFLNIEELTTQLEKLNLLEYVHAFGFYVIQPTLNTQIHIDSTDRNYSFNLPILNCDNTFVNFYTTEIEHKPLLFFSPEDCIKIDEVEMSEPHIVHVKVPHNVSVYHNKTRITLLIRLNEKFTLDKVAI